MEVIKSVKKFLKPEFIFIFQKELLPRSPILWENEY